MNWLPIIGLLVLLAAGPSGQAQHLPTKQEVQHFKQTEPDVWYADSLPPQKTPPPPEDAPRYRQQLSTREPFSMPDLGWLSWLLMGGLVAGIGYAIYTGKFTHQWRRNKKATPPDSTIAEEEPVIETAEELGRINFRELAHRAEGQGNWRLAIRYNYLWIIQQLHAKGHISFRKNKTNEEYVAELAQWPYVADFKRVTFYYNNIWFGEYPIGSDNYSYVVMFFYQLLSRVS